MSDSPSFHVSPAKGIKARIVHLLGERGGYVATYDLPQLLDRVFGSAVDEAACATAVTDLLGNGTLTAAEDQGSLVCLAQAPQDPVLPTDSLPSEASLMPSLKAYLDNEFRTVVEGGEGSGYMSINTSTRGPRKGTWRRPDYTVVNVLDLPLLGRRQVDVHAIELKREHGCSVPSVFEALSQSRETNYAYLAWMLPSQSAKEVDLPEIMGACEHHGIGLIRLRPKGDAKSGSTGKVIVRPRRCPTDDLTTHRYLAGRLSKSERETLLAHVRAAS